MKKLGAFSFGDLGWAGLSLLAFVIALSFGATEDLSWEWVRELRLPRAVLAFSIGAALSVSGALLQAFFKNPLCEPYTLGVSSGATLGAVIGATLGWSASTFAGFAPGALFGALAFSAVLLLLSRARKVSQSTLLLCGVMLGFVGSSLVAVWMALADPAGIQSAIGWLLGDLSRAESANAYPALIGVAIAIGAIYFDHRSYDALLLGEEEASSLGVDVRRLRTRVILWSSLLVAFAVSVSGMIGFIGLVIPQLVRRTGSSLHRRVIPVGAIAGGAVLVLSDALARTLVAPHELPVGVVTSLAGAPLFIFLLVARTRVKKG
jgi:iron complex transport system permease protein